MLELLRDPKILQVCSYEEFKPVVYGNGKGYEADILRAIAQLWSVDICFYPQKIYENIWNMPLEEGFDVAAAGIAPQPERKKHAIYSIPTAFYSQSLLIRKADYLSGDITGYESFNNNHFKIGVVKKSDGEKFGHERAKDCGLNMAIFKQYTSESELLPALLKGDIAAIARGDIGNDYQASCNNQLMTIAKKNYQEYICFSVSPQRKGFLEALNKAIQTVTNSGKTSYQDWYKDNDVFNKNLLTIGSQR